MIVMVITSNMYILHTQKATLLAPLHLNKAQVLWCAHSTKKGDPAQITLYSCQSV
jgi:hypothetical protein